MSELTDILNQLPELGFELNPPANEYQLNSLYALGKEIVSSNHFPPNRDLPYELAELYMHHNGMPYSPKNSEHFDMRLMSVEEAIPYNYWQNYFYRDHYKHLAPILKGISFFWQDWNSNSMGMYVSGELKGMIFVLDHANIDLSPRFSSLNTMYQHWISCTKFNIENKEAIKEDDKEPLWAVFSWSYPDPEATEYPRTKPSENDEKELKISLSYIEKAKVEENERTRREYLLIALNLIPFPHTEKLLPFLDDTDQFVQARAVEFLSKRKYEGAVEQFAKVVIHGQHNGQLAAINALGSMETHEAEQKLLELLTIVKPEWKNTIVGTLRYHFDYEMKKLDKNRLAYRKSPDDEWIEI